MSDFRGSVVVLVLCAAVAGCDGATPGSPWTKPPWRRVAPSLDAVTDSSTGVTCYRHKGIRVSCVLTRAVQVPRA